jgi:hypothetical protein
VGHTLVNHTTMGSSLGDFYSSYIQSTNKIYAHRHTHMKHLRVCDMFIPVDSRNADTAFSAPAASFSSSPCSVFATSSLSSIRAKFLPIFPVIRLATQLVCVDALISPNPSVSQPFSSFRIGEPCPFQLVQLFTCCVVRSIKSSCGCPFHRSSSVLIPQPSTFHSLPKDF